MLHVSRQAACRRAAKLYTRQTQANRAATSSRLYSAAADAGSEEVAAPGIQFTIDPAKILPHEYGDVRILNNTTRDAQQSNCSAEMADEHRQAITKLIDACYEPTTASGQAPGYEQIWGGESRTAFLYPCIP